MANLADKLNEPPEICDEALSCPFCGEPAQIQYWHGGRASKRLIGCSSDDCDVAPSVTGETRAEALRIWNTRP